MKRKRRKRSDTFKMAEDIKQKDISNQISTLALEVAKGFARSDALGEGIQRRLDVLNGKVAEHERSIKSQEVKDAVQADRVSALQKNEQNSKLWRSSVGGQGLQIIFDLIKLGLVALITFWIINLN